LLWPGPMLRLPCVRDDRGGVLHTEYLILTAFIGLLLAAAIVALGAPLLEHYRFMQALLTTPVV
jgi:Flp pilus assembly pilin Flp